MLMGDSFSDDEFDIGTAGGIPVICMCGRGKRGAQARDKPLNNLLKTLL